MEKLFSKIRRIEETDKFKGGDPKNWKLNNEDY